LGEQAQLAGGTAALATNPRFWQRDFLADQGDEIIPQIIDLLSNRVEKLATAQRQHLAQRCKSAGRCSHRRFHFGHQYFQGFLDRGRYASRR
jgi:hypothetical protein